MRKLSALFVAAALAATLAGCTSSTPPEPVSTCTTGPKAGATSALVSTVGAANTKPTSVSFPTPLVGKGIQVSTVTATTGATVRSGDIADLMTFVYNGKDGSFNTSGTIRARIGDGKNVFSDLAECATVGSRIAVTLPRNKVFTSTDGSVVPNDTVVLVIDVKARYLGQANGSDQIPQAGFPSVVTTESGEPGLTILNQAAPKQLKYSVLKQGSGATVKKGDAVVVNYTGVLWDDKTVFDSTWKTGSAATVIAQPLAAAADGSPIGVVDGFATALIGQKVGSQVIVIVPPANGFGSNTAPSGVTPTSTLVYVFDVLGIQ